MTEWLFPCSGEEVLGVFAGRRTLIVRALDLSPDPRWNRQSEQSWCTGNHERSAACVADFTLPVRWVVGDQLVVQEGWQLRLDGSVAYRASDVLAGADSTDPMSWQSPLDMAPRFSRLRLLVVGRAIRRLRDLTAADVAKCGFDGINPVYDFGLDWKKQNGEDALWRNPWVAALTVQKVEAEVADYGHGR